MVVLILVTLLVVGLCLGSFVNAFVWRHYERERLDEELQGLATKLHAKDAAKRKQLEVRREQLSIARGRSMCTHCGHPLSARDLIPVLSYVWSRGRCRYCGKRIEDSPLAELLTPLLFVVSYLCWPMELRGLQLVVFGFWLVFLVAFVALTLYDRRWFLLPHSIVLPLIGLAVVRAVVLAIISPQGISLLVSALVSALVIGGTFYALYRVSNEKWIGGGDVTLGTMLGLLVASPSKAVLLIFIASLLGTLMALPLLVMGKAVRNTRLPFGPFLMLAAIIVTLFGQAIIDWYVRSFLTI